MKKTLLFLGMIAVSAVTSGVTVWTVDRSHTDKIEYIEREVERTPALGSHFTAYEADKYPDLTYAAENAVKAVVNIEAIQQVDVSSGYGGGAYDPFFEFFGIPQGYGRRGGQPQTQERRAGGSGVIISDDGYIVTNNHVIEDATKLRVKLNDGRKFDAKVIGTDPTTDVALIKVEGKDLPTIPFGNSEGLRLGEWVLAIGSPFDLQSTITAGIVSAKARQLDVIPDQFRIESFIQTDAAVVVDLKEYGVVQRALLGISYRYIDQDFIDQMGKETGIKELGGVYVATVSEDGAASAAGIRKGDVIVAIDGVKIDNASAVQEQIAKHRPNDKVKITVKRDGAVKLFDVTLRNKAGKTELITREAVDVTAALGGKFRDAGTKLCQELEIKGGVQVVGIKSNGILARARVKEGFVITHINDRPVYSLSDMERMSDKITSIDGIYPNGRAASYMLVE